MATELNKSERCYKLIGYLLLFEIMYSGVD